MSIQTAVPLTSQQIVRRAVLARRRTLINQKAASIQVTVERDGKPVSRFLNTLEPLERAQAIQQLLSSEPAPAAPQPVPAAPIAASSEKAPEAHTVGTLQKDRARSRSKNTKTTKKYTPSARKKK